MTEKLWFKQWASTYLTDPRIDRLTDAAAVLLQRMRCVCCLEGSCPVQTFEIARKTMRSENQVIMSLPSVLQFFVQKDDRLFDVAQERDNAVTERGRKGALAANAKRKAPATSDAAGDAPADAPTELDGYGRLRSSDAASDAQGDGASDAHAKVDAWLEGLGRMRSSVAAGDAADDAQKLEVRSIEVKNLETHSAFFQKLDPTHPVQNVENVPRGTLDEDLEAARRQFLKNQAIQISQRRGNALAIPDGHGGYTDQNQLREVQPHKPQSSTTNTNTGQERREA